jgi:uncharacterized protein (TIGR02246 family)
LQAEALESIKKRMRRLEDIEEIRQLLVDYGQALDRRDFAGFSGLFAEDAEYSAGGSTFITKGPAAIGALLEEIFRKNPTGLRSPNYHIFANEIIRVDGDEAVAISKGAFIAPNNANEPILAMLATYEDMLVRENGRWKFKRRIVHADIPAPPLPK